MTPTTTLPVAAIAAHWHAPCSYEYMFFNKWLQGRTRVDEDTLEHFLVKTVRNFKLHLKPLSALKDEEVVEMARLVADPASPTVLKHSGTIYLKWLKDSCDYSFNIDTEDGIVCLDIDDLGECPVNHAPLLRWLREHGYYTPGSIEEEFVQLIEG